MKTQRFVLERLLGMEPWRTPGSSELRPTVLDRFSFSRPEGYEKVDEGPLDYDGSNALTPASSQFTSVIGKDGTGLASMGLADGSVSITRKLVELGNKDPGALSAGVSYAHIPGFGAYADGDHIVGTDLDFDVFTGTGLSGPTFDVDEISTAPGGGTPTLTGTGAVPTRAEAACYHANTDQFMVVVGNQLYRSNAGDFTTWDNAAVTLPASATWRDMHSNGTTIILVGNSGVSYRSTDDGATWSSITIDAGQDISGISYGGGKWVAASDSSDGLYSSANDGATWTTGINRGGGFLETMRYYDVAYDSSVGRWVASEGEKISLAQSCKVSNDGHDWGTPGQRRLKGATYKGIAANGEGTFVIVADRTATPVTGQGIIARSFDGGSNWSHASLTDRGFTHVVWNDYEFVATGYDAQMGSSGVARSTDGHSWSDQSASYDLAGTQLGPLVVASDGTTIVWSKNAGAAHPVYQIRVGTGTATSGGSSRLQAGRYEAIWLATVATQAGKAVVASGTEAWSLSAGATGVLTVTPPGIAPTELLGNLRYEIYLRYAPEVEDDATEQFVTENLDGREFVLAITLNDNDGPKVVVYPEVGRVLPDVGNVGTMAVNGVATYYQDRVWYKPSATEAAYGFVNGEPAIDSLSRPMTLGFTEIEYLNLTGESFYLHLPQGSSTKITGLLATPSGLMAFGENDAYLVTGDPAIEGSLRVEVFPDSIGCDDGLDPVILGGRPFVVWRGRLYAIDGAQAVDISQGVLDGRVSIYDVAADSKTKTIAVLTAEGVLHFDIDIGEWYRSEVWRRAGSNYIESAYASSARILPSPTGLHIFTGEAAFTAASKIKFYYDTSGSLDSSLPALRDMVTDLKALLTASPYNVNPANITETDSSTERWVSWLDQPDNDYIVFAVINESNPVYHGTSSDSGPTGQWTTDYNNAVAAMQAATIRSRALIYGIANQGATSAIQVFMEQHLPRAVDGTNGYPSSPSLADVGVDYQTYIPENRTAAEYLEDIETFLFLDGDGTGEIVTYDPTENVVEPLVIEWRNIDAGDALRRDYWRYVRIPIDTKVGEFELTVGTTAYLYYSIADADPDVSTENASYRATGRLVGEELVFKIPWGLAARRADFRLVINTDQRVAIQPGISFGHSPGPMGDLLSP